jgi:hypothetical protein
MTDFVVPANLEDMVPAGEVWGVMEQIAPLLVAPAGDTLIACQQCGVPRPYFCIYDTRERPEFAHDWTCESCVGAVRRDAVAAAEG